MTQSLGPQLFTDEDRYYMLRDLPDGAFEFADEIERDVELETDHVLEAMMRRFPNDPCVTFAVVNAAGKRFAKNLRFAVNEGHVRRERAREVLDHLATYILGNGEQGQSHDEPSID